MVRPSLAREIGHLRVVTMSNKAPSESLVLCVQLILSTLIETRQAGRQRKQVKQTFLINKAGNLTSKNQSLLQPQALQKQPMVQTLPIRGLQPGCYDTVAVQKPSKKAVLSILI